MGDNDTEGMVMGHMEGKVEEETARSRRTYIYAIAGEFSKDHQSLFFGMALIFLDASCFKSGIYTISTAHDSSAAVIHAYTGQRMSSGRNGKNSHWSSS